MHEKPQSKNVGELTKKKSYSRQANVALFSQKLMMSWTYLTFSAAMRIMCTELSIMCHYN